MVRRCCMRANGDDAANTRLLAPYSTPLDLYADWRVAKDWSLQARSTT